MPRKSEIFGGFWMVPKGSKGLSLEARFILGMLVTRMNGENEAWPSQQSMADEIGCHKRSVVRYMKELESGGHLLKTRTGLGLSNCYKLSTPGDNLSLQEVTPLSPPEVPPCHFPLSNQKESLEKNITPLPPKGGRGVDGKRRRRSNAQPKRKPFIEGCPAFYDELRGTWRTQNYTGEWVDYVGNVKDNLVYREV